MANPSTSPRAHKSSQSRDPRSAGARLLDYLFGFDFFISYARADGGAYADALRDKLQHRSFRCFIDHRELPAASPLDASIYRALKQSTVLIVVASPGSRRPESWLPTEVAYYRVQRRRYRILPVDVGGTLANAAPASPLREQLRLAGDPIWLSEELAALPAGPSDAVLARIVGSFRFTRRNTLRFRALSATAVALAALTLAAAFWAVQSRIARRDAADQRQQAEANRRVAVRNFADELSIRGAQELDAGNELASLSYFSNAAALATTARTELYTILQPVPRWTYTGRVPRDADVDRIAASPRGDLAATCDRTGTVHVLRFPLFDPVDSVPLGTILAQRLAFGQDGRHLVIGGTVAVPAGHAVTPADSGVGLLVYDCDAKRVVRTLNVPGVFGSVSDVAATADGRFIAAVVADAAYVWDGDGGPTRIGGLDAGVESIVAQPKQDVLAIGCGDGHVRVRSLSDGRFVADLSIGITGQTVDYTAPISLCFSPDGNTLAVGSIDRSVRLWKWRSTDDLPLRLTGHTAPVTGVAFCDRGATLVSSSDDHSVRFWNVARGTAEREIGPFEMEVLTLVASANGATLVTCEGGKGERSGKPGAWRRWAEGGGGAADDRSAGLDRADGASYVNDQLWAWGAAGGRFAVSRAGQVTTFPDLIPWPTPNPSLPPTVPTAPAGTRIAMSLAVDASGRALVVSTVVPVAGPPQQWDARLEVYAVTDAGLAKRNEIPVHGGLAVATFCGDAETIAYGCPNPSPGTVHLVRLSGETPSERVASGGGGGLVRCSSDGSIIATETDEGRLIVRSAADLRVLLDRPSQVGVAGPMAFVGGSTDLLFAEFDAVLRWDHVTHEVGPILPGGNGMIRAVATTDDGRLLAIVNANGQLSFSDASTGQTLGRSPLGDPATTSLGFNSGTSRLVGTGPGGIHVWGGNVPGPVAATAVSHLKVITDASPAGDRQGHAGGDLVPADD